jgi:regulator of protease activity HflC (stomatin/prohibitin superfamily)
MGFQQKNDEEVLQIQFKKIKKIVLFTVLGLFAFFVFMGSFDTVSPGQRGIRVTLGKTGEEVLGEGPHFKLPFVSYIKTMSVRVHKSQDQTEAATKDLQRIGATVALNWTVDPNSVGKMIREVGDEEAIENNVIAPAVSEVLKAATAKLTAEEILTRRMELKTTIDDMLVKRLTTYGLVVKDISLVNLDFTKEFNEAVEAKQIAEQKAKQAEYAALQAIQDAKAKVNEAKGDAESRLINARAQAESQKLLKQTISGNILSLEYIKKWDGQLPKVMGGNSGLLLNIDLNKTDSKRDEEE